MCLKIKVNFALAFIIIVTISLLMAGASSANAAVTALDTWTNIYSLAPGDSSGTVDAGNLTVSSGSNRLFLAAVCTEYSTTGWLHPITGVSLGGTALTLINDTYAFSTEHCWMGYLKESQIPSGSNMLSVDYDVGTATVTGIHVKWASYSDVNQVMPVNDSNAYASGWVTNAQFGAQIDYITDGLTLYVAANGGTPATMTAPTDFSQVGSGTTTDGHSSFIGATASHSSNGNYASGTTVTFGGTTTNKVALVVAALNPPATVVGNGTNPSNATVCPGDGATMLDAFTLTSSGTDTVTAMTVTLQTGTSGSLSLVEITSDDGSTVYGSVLNPALDTVAITLSTNIPVTTTETQYKVRITPKSHAVMSPGSYLVTGRVTEITCTDPIIYGDTSSATITIDNTPPGTQTMSGIPGDEQVVLNWSTAFTASEYVLVRDTSVISGTPEEGKQYSIDPPDNVIGSSTVIYVGSGLTHTDTGLTNGVNYYYKIFARDTCGNYNSGAVPPSPNYYTPNPVVTLSSSGTQVTTMNAGSSDNYIGAAFTFQQSSGTADTVSALTISETGTAIANTELTNAKVYYESDVASCAYNGTESSIDTSFNGSDKIVLSSISIPVTLAPNYTCVYVVFDVDPSALNNTAVDLEITSSGDFTLGGGTNKNSLQSYPVALSGTTTLRSETTNVVKVGSFQSGTSTGYVNVTGVGFQPKAVIFFWTRQSSTGFSSVMSIGEGFATAGPPIVNRSVTGICFDNENPTICGRRRTETYSILLFKDDEVTPLSGQGYVSSFDPDGFTIYWNNAPGIDTYINYVALSGDDNFDAKAGTITATTSTGNQSFTGVGFEPNFVMFLASSNESLNTNVSHLFLNTGFMSTSGQAAVSIRGRNNQTTTGHATSQQRTTQAIMGLQLNGTQDWLASYVSMDSDGFTLNFSDAPSANMPIFYLALKGGMHKVGTFNQPGSGTPPFTQDITTVGFQPVGLFMASVNRYIPTWNEAPIVPEGEISIGAASSSTERATIWGETRDIVPPSDSNMSITTDTAIRLATTATINSEADFDSFLANGFRLNWTTRNDTTQRTVVYWAIGNATTIVGNGADPLGTTICPGDGAWELDAFTLKTSTGTDTVTDVTVKLYGTFWDNDFYEAVSRVEITSDDGLTVYGFVEDPTSNDILINLDTNIPVTTTAIQYRVRITPKSHDEMPDTNLLYQFRGKVAGITCVNAKSYNDSSNQTTIDNNSPSNPTTFSGTPGDSQIEFTWLNFGGTIEVVILRNTTSITDYPIEGEQYVEGNYIGSSLVVYVNNDIPLSTTFTDTELIGGDTYYYKIFAKDSCGNYSSGISTTTPYTTTTIDSSGTQTPTMEAGSTDNYIGAAFTFQQSSGTNTITDLTISETGTALANTELTNVEVYYETDVATCTYNGTESSISTSFDGSEQIVLSSVSIPVTVSATNYTCIYVVFDVDLLTVDGHTVELEITSSDDFTLSSSTVKMWSDAVELNGTTTLEDTTPPADITGLTVAPNDGQITFNWTNPTDADFEGVRISRATGGTPPTDCSTGTDIANPGTSYIDTGLTNGTTYSYRFCTYDEVPNYSSGVTTSETPPQIPLLDYPAAPYDDGKHPDTGDTTTDYTFKLIYYDLENDAPATGYPRIYIGDNDGFVYGHAMSPDPSADPPELYNGNYVDGEQYMYGPIGLGAAQDLRFYFEAKAATGYYTEVAVQLPPAGFDPLQGPSVYLLLYNNMVGVPKDLGSGTPYYNVLQDDSGAKYCIYWESTGLDTGTWQGLWQYCINGNIEKGKGYFIWSMAADNYRLDEPAGMGNVTDAYVDIALDPDGGWTMISNPYNVNIELQDVKVMRFGDATEYSYSDAVINGWIYPAIYEYEGPETEYDFKEYNGSPPALLEPWMGYFIYVNDITEATTLRVYKPVQ